MPSKMYAQDIHYSQFYNSPLNINPALTGIFNGDVRVIGSLRDQWRQIPVPYSTFSANYDQKYYTKNRDKGFWGIGVIFNYDVAGDARFNTTQLNLTGSYSYLLNRQNILTTGLLLGFSTEGLSQGKLTWDNYWTGAIADPRKGSGEIVDASRTSYLESGLGLNYRFQKSARTNVNLGIAFWHLIPPSVSLRDADKVNLPIRMAVNFTSIFKIANPLDIQLHGIYAKQSVYNQLLAGGLLRFHLNNKAGKKFAIDAGASYRVPLTDGDLGDFIPKLALHFNQWYVGASYDINLGSYSTKFDVRPASPEIHVRYVITHVKPMDKRKSCPIF